MELTFHELANLEPVDGHEDLAIPRAKALHNAILAARDYALVHLLRQHRDGQVTQECIVVDVECDGIPSRNAIGIRYRERLALCVPLDVKQLVEVLALRRDFPTTIHQYDSPLGTPANLCLYFEPLPSILRTWTPQKFLRRIQWWLEQTSKGTLHPADQPVEQLFFRTNYELVLPWNFDEVREPPAPHAQRFVIQCAPTRSDTRKTYFLCPLMGNNGGHADKIAPIELTLSPIIHGHIEREPGTLGQLADVLSQRGVDLLPALRDAAAGRVAEMGIAVEDDDDYSVVLLHIPMIRRKDAEIESVSHRAFLLQIGTLELGASIGTLFELDGKYFRAMGVLDSPASTSWRSQTLFPMEVLRYNNSSDARRQSACSGESPTGVLVGVGALGSTILGLWGRSGWGNWTVIDKDHIRPHNLVRHVAYAQHVGQPKTDVVAELHGAVMQDASHVTPLCADALDLSNDRVLRVLKKATLVVDASATIEYPRIASGSEGVGRHVSVFITPSGNAAVLMAEDEKRTVRLRTLEAQYYRAVIQEDWGKRHLQNNLGTFWTGASCRDISVILPYSRVVTHAGRLAEQVRRAVNQPNALIRVWTGNPDTGETAMHEISVRAERWLPLEEINTFIDDGLVHKLRSQRETHLPDETGGVLLGYHDFNIGALVLVDALPAPPDSRASGSYFERGVEGLARAVAEASRRTAGIVEYVGEWHSHPPGHSSDPSDADICQLDYLTRGMANDGLPTVSLIVGEADIQVLKVAVST